MKIAASVDGAKRPCAPFLVKKGRDQTHQEGRQAHNFEDAYGLPHLPVRLCQANVVKKIAVALDHVVKWTTVLCVFLTSKTASYIKRKPTPHLKKHHKAKRIAFTKKNLNKVEFWERVLFTDENKFNLDGPGGCQYYWHVILKDPETYSKRVAGDGSVIV